MFKQTLFLILIFFTTVQVASARSYIRSHEDYVHLSDSEKDQMIIKTMELVVELEARYEKDLETYGFNQHRYDLYVETLSKISRLFIADATADTSKDWTTMGNEFITLLKRPESRCLFAGWVSTAAKDKSGKTVCNHPGKASAKSSPEAKAYPVSKSSECKSGDSKKIQCSPLIFGYKKESDHSLFCVDATDGAHNSSYNCMQEALASGAAQKGDKKEDRLKHLRERLTQNPEIFKGVQEFTYKTCVCDEIDPGVNFNKEYHDYMRPHRTCYGLMEMMGDTLICENPNPSIDVSIFKSLRDYAKNKVLKGKEADELYSNFLKTEVVKSAPDEYKRLCGSGVPVEGQGNKNNNETPLPQVVVSTEKPMECTATCKPSTDKNTPFICSFEVTNAKKDKKYELATTPTEMPKSDQEKTLKITNTIEKKERTLECSLTFDKPKDDEKKPTIKVKVKDKTAHEVTLATEITDKSDWKIVWITYNPPEKEEGPKAQKPSQTPGMAITTDLNEQSDEKKDEKKNKKKDEKKDQSTNFTEGDEEKDVVNRPKKEISYEVCAELRKEGKTPVRSCTSVEALDKDASKPASTTPRPGPFTGTGMPQQPMQMRNSSDVSGLGIR